MPSSQSLIDKVHKLRERAQIIKQGSTRHIAMPKFYIYEGVPEQIYIDCIDATLSIDNNNQVEKLAIIISCFIKIRDVIVQERKAAPHAVPFYYNLNIFFEVLSHLQKNAGVDIMPLYLCIKGEAKAFAAVLSGEYRGSKMIKKSLTDGMKYLHVTGDANSLKGYIDKIYLRKNGKLLRLENGQLIFDKLLEEYIENYLHADNVEQRAIKEVLDYAYEKTVGKITNTTYDYKKCKTNILKEVMSSRTLKTSLLKLMQNERFYGHLVHGANKEERDNRAIEINKEILIFIQNKIDIIHFIKSNYPQYFEKSIKVFEHENFVNSWSLRANIHIYAATLRHCFSDENYFLDFMEKQEEFIDMLGCKKFFKKNYPELMVNIVRDVYLSLSSNNPLKTPLLDFLEFSYNKYPSNIYIEELGKIKNSCNKISLKNNETNFEQIDLFLENKILLNITPFNKVLAKKIQKI